MRTSALWALGLAVVIGLPAAEPGKNELSLSTSGMKEPTLVIHGWFLNKEKNRAIEIKVESQEAGHLAAFTKWFNEARFHLSPDQPFLGGARVSSGIYASFDIRSEGKAVWHYQLIGADNLVDDKGILYVPESRIYRALIDTVIIPMQVSPPPQQGRK